MDEVLLAAVYRSPHEDAPRLVYADWLAEHGQRERAELIRYQCQTPRLPPYYDELDDRAYDLVDAHRAAWTSHLPQDEKATWKFHRGFPEELEIDMEVLLEAWPLWSAAPRVRYLTLWNTTAYFLRFFALQNWNPAWKVLRLGQEPKPWLHEQPYDPSSGVRAVASSPQAGLLRELYFDWHALGEDGIAALCESPQLEQLSMLGVDAEYIEEPQLVKRFGYRLQRSSTCY